mmetsp:Transcript_22078/g.37262  ORF Transcript_22078/g.37262 Transcript_22078/m.37262 type:complete len:189 (+) Transcript_22078:2-568(+)
MANYITAPGITILSSSGKGENSYALPTLASLGVSTADRFTYSMYQYFLENMMVVESSTTRSMVSNRGTTRKIGPSKFKEPVAAATSSGTGNNSRKLSLHSYTLHDLYSSFRKSFLYSTPVITQSPGGTRSPKDMKLLEFFGGWIPNENDNYSDNVIYAKLSSSDMTQQASVQGIVDEWLEELTEGESI